MAEGGEVLDRGKMTQGGVVSKVWLSCSQWGEIQVYGQYMKTYLTLNNRPNMDNCYK